MTVAKPKKNKYGHVADDAVDRMMSSVPSPVFDPPLPLETRAERRIRAAAARRAQGITQNLEDEKSPDVSFLNYVDASDVTPRKVDWLMDQRIPRGMMVCIAGVQGEGKSMIIADQAARISAGRPFILTPHVPNPAKRVILFAAEDSFDCTLVPRLIAHGADLTKVRLMNTVKGVDGEERLFSITSDLHILEAMVAELGDVGLVVFDPVDNFLGEGINPNKADQVRPVLTRLKSFCERLNLTVEYIKHLNKSTMDNALHRVAGTSAYTEVPRCVWFIIRDREDPERRKFLCGKMNVAKIPPGAEFTIDQNVVMWTATELEESANDAMSTAVDEEMSTTKVGQAEEWLHFALANEAVKANDIYAESTKYGIKKRTLNRAKANLKVQTDWTTYPKRQAWWRLPNVKSAFPLVPPLGNGGIGGNGGNQDDCHGCHDGQGSHIDNGNLRGNLI